ncbi:hypothetical protein CLO73_24675 [Salmonella enterica]|nr:hypothetical protein [Salmonella enterica]
MKILTPVAAILVCFALIGCKEEAKTVKWYQEHPSELQRVYNDCKKTGEDSDNCRNAISANHQEQQKNAPIPKYSPVN